MIKKLLLILVAIIAALIVVVTTRPDDFRFSRSTNIAAPPTVVFEHVNDFHKWDAWSPWAKLDPNSKATFEGSPSGQGAIFKWAGNGEVGEGQQTIVESRAPELVRIKLEFTKPFTATNDVEFTFKPEGSGTRVTWTMSGKNNFIGKAISLVMDCEKMVGPMFEKGLASMKTVAEVAPKP
ncbi:MAG: SRPBCC family protein [Roseimicrobium sp.]